MVWQVGGPKGHGAELMINIAIVSMHVILYIDILGPTFVMSGGGGMAPLPPPVPPPMLRHEKYRVIIISLLYTCSICTSFLCINLPFSFPFSINQVTQLAILKVQYGLS